MNQIKRPKIAYHGWLNLWKPVGMSSMQAVAAVRRHTGAKKIGHAGTLDPLADGVLPIALGEATKLIPLLHDNLKAYRFGVNWGVATNTDDTEGESIATSDVRPTREAILAALPQFTGTIDQIPPPYSAIKIKGERAYALARKGESFEIDARPVYIDSFALVDMPTKDEAIFEVVCGTGTYVRSLARDLAQNLGSCGHCSFITRQFVGKFAADTAISLENIADMDYTAFDATLWPLAQGLDDILVLAVTDIEAQALRRGQDVRFLSRMDSARLPAVSDPESPVLALYGDDVVAICRLDGITLSPRRVITV